MKVAGQISQDYIFVFHQNVTSISTKLSASMFVQINNARDIFIGNFRIRYNPREGNDLYLVFNEYRGFMDGEAIPLPPPYYSRTILLKYTHTFRL
jgi:hypothetical protein